MLIYNFLNKEDFDKQIFKKQVDDVLSWSLLMNKDCVVHDLLVLFKDKESIGYILHDNCVIKKLEIKEKYRNSGYGSLMLQSFINYNYIFNVPCVITLKPINKSVVPFYERNGFTRNENGEMYITNDPYYYHFDENMVETLVG